MRTSPQFMMRWPGLIFLALAATSRATQAAPTGFFDSTNALGSTGSSLDSIDSDDLSMISPPLLLMRAENVTDTETTKKLPIGSSMIQFSPSAQTKATVPLYVSAAWNAGRTSPASRAYIVWHGSQRNGQSSFNDVHAALSSAGNNLDTTTSDILVIALQFYTPNDASKRRLFDSARNLAWQFTGDANTKSRGSTFGLFDGTDAIAPAGETDPTYGLNGAKISTFDVLDSVISYISNRAYYPNMQRITLVGHSAGGQAISRYMTLNPAVLSGLTGIHIRSVIANAPSMVYFTNDRPDNPAAQTVVSTRRTSGGAISSNGCDFNDWRYGLQGYMPRYVTARARDGPGDGLRLFTSYIAKDVVRLVGTNDVYALAEGSGDQTCAVLTQGGENRRDRNYAAWAYLNLLAATNEDVSAFYGYANLSQSVHPVAGLGSVFNHQLGIVSGVGHDSTQMFASPVGISALLDDRVQPGPRPPPAPAFESSK